MHDDCEWEIVEHGNDEYWSTDCGHLWSFLEGGPTENRMKFCPYCGQTLVEILPEN